MGKSREAIEFMTDEVEFMSNQLENLLETKSTASDMAHELFSTMEKVLKRLGKLDVEQKFNIGFVAFDKAASTICNVLKSCETTSPVAPANSFDMTDAQRAALNGFLEKVFVATTEPASAVDSNGD